MRAMFWVADVIPRLETGMPDKYVTGHTGAHLCEHDVHAVNREGLGAQILVHRLGICVVDISA